MIVGACIGFAIGVVTGIRGVVGRDSQGFLLAESLDSVGPLGTGTCITDVCHQHMPDEIFRKVFVMLLCGLRLIDSHSRRIKHKPANSLKFHPGSKVPSPFPTVSAPVLIHIQTPVAVQILEGISVFYEQLYPRFRAIAQNWSPALFHQHITLLLFKTY